MSELRKEERTEEMIGNVLMLVVFAIIGLIHLHALARWLKR